MACLADDLHDMSNLIFSRSTYSKPEEPYSYVSQSWHGAKQKIEDKSSKQDIVQGEHLKYYVNRSVWWTTW